MAKINIRFNALRFLSLRKTANSCCLFLFFLVLFFQQLLTFNALKEDSNRLKAACRSQHIPNVPTGPQISAHVPTQSSPIRFEMEVEVTEEDETKNNLEGYNPTVKHAVEQLVYTSFLRSRFLQMASSVHKQPRVPFFILYHSWKNFLA